MPEAFRSFASIFALGDVTTSPAHARFTRTPPASAPSAAAIDPAPATAIDPAPAAAPLAAEAGACARVDERVSDLLDVFVADLARLRARAAERLEECAEALLADLATRVLARELRAAPAEVSRLIDEALREFPAGGSVAIRVCDDDATRLQAAWPVVIDPELRPGDFSLELEDGRYDASLQTRLDALLATHRFAL